VWVLPEMRRRQQAGEPEVAGDLRAAQIIFFADSRKPVVRINSEVRAIARARVKGPRQTGDPIYEHELQELNDIRLTDAEDPDCGHITLIRIGDKWSIAWDCRYNKSLARRHLEAASRFLAAARFCMANDLTEPFVDNLFSAVELVIRAHLLSVPDPGFRKDTTHREIKQRFKRMAVLGNFSSALVEAYEVLHKLRPRARYTLVFRKPSRSDKEVLFSRAQEAYREALECFSDE
jgi:hypothetical protein